MIILETPVQHGPHLWYAAHLLTRETHSMDFLRLEAAGKPHHRNAYTFINAEPIGDFLARCPVYGDL